MASYVEAAILDFLENFFSTKSALLQIFGPINLKITAIFKTYENNFPFFYFHHVWNIWNIESIGFTPKKFDFFFARIMFFTDKKS
jgi:hypothetical protein